MSDFNTQLADRIYQLRKQRQLKQSTVAYLMDITQQGYSYIERHPGSMEMKTARRLCQVLRVDMPFLFALEIPVTDANLAIMDEVKTLPRLLHYLHTSEAHAHLKIV